MSNDHRGTDRQMTFLEEWSEFFGQHINLDKIERSCLDGKLRGSHVRSIIWRILMKCLPLNREEWCAIISRSRGAYALLKLEVIKNPPEDLSDRNVEVNNHPLSLGEKNPWEQYFMDCELRKCINRDVERTFPELQFFKGSEIRSIMSDVLFVYAKMHPEIAYKQGMHEIIAPLIFVIYYDQQTFAHLAEQNELQLMLPFADVSILSVVNDQQFLEHDSYELFTQIMMLMEKFYLTSGEGAEASALTSSKKNKLHQDSEPFSNDYEVEESSSEMARALRRIINEVLASVDSQLHLHLKQLEILPQIYGIRWLRLLFGREFPIHDLLFVWDAIFAFDRSLSLVDYVFVAMLVQIRHLRSFSHRFYSRLLQQLYFSEWLWLRAQFYKFLDFL